MYAWFQSQWKKNKKQKQPREKTKEALVTATSDPRWSLKVWCPNLRLSAAVSSGSVNELEHSELINQSEFPVPTSSTRRHVFDKVNFSDEICNQREKKPNKEWHRENRREQWADMKHLKTPSRSRVPHQSGFFASAQSGRKQQAERCHTHTQKNNPAEQLFSDSSWAWKVNRLYI